MSDLHDLVPEGIDLKGYVCFDHDSEEPHDLSHVKAMVGKNPRLAHEFHVFGRPGLTFHCLRALLE